MAIKDRLKEWTPFEVAQYEIGLSLGLLSGTLKDNEGLLWTDSDIGVKLYEIINDLIELKILEYNDEALKIRWQFSLKEEEK